MQSTASTVEKLGERVVEIIENPEEAAQSTLSIEEVAAFRQGADSIIEARRSAPLNEGQLQIC